MNEKMSPAKRLGILAIVIVLGYLVVVMLPYWVGGYFITNSTSETSLGKWVMGIALIVGTGSCGVVIYFAGKWIMTGRGPFILAFAVLLLTSCGRYGYIVRSPTGEKYYTKKVKEKKGCITFKTRNGRQYVMGKYKIEKIKR